MIVVKLVNYTPNPEETVYLAAKTCWKWIEPEELPSYFKVSKEERKRLIQKLIRLGHHSVLEHASFTFFIQGLTRVVTHQLVRHRIASYSQLGGRHLKEPPLMAIPEEVYLLEDVEAGKKAEEIISDVYEKSRETFKKLIELGLSIESARYVLPQGQMAQILVTMNARELRHFFKLRVSEEAQSETRWVAAIMLKLCYEVAPILFEDIFKEKEKYVFEACMLLGYSYPKRDSNEVE